MSSSDFFTRLERQLVEAAEREVAVSPARRRFAGLIDGLRPRRLAVALPMVASALVVGAIVAVILSLGGEQPQVEAGRGPLAEPTDGLTVEPLGTAPTGTAIPLPVPPPRPGTAPNRAVPLPLAPNAPRPIPTGSSVFLLNGTTRDGVAAEAARLLETRGATVSGTGNAKANTVSRSLVYSTAAAGGRTKPARTVGQLLGLPVAPGLAPPDVGAAAQGSEVVVLLGADYLDRKDREVSLSGPGGVSGVVTLAKNGGLAFTGEGLPPSNRYFLWVEDRSGKAIGIGFAQYGAKQRRVAGEIDSLPGSLDAVTTRRIFLTREKTKRPNPRSMGPIVLDSGRIGG